jgi:glutamate-1-semialdehyde 2,1-aminomutase
MSKSQDMYIRAKTIIPGGTQLLSKRPEMFIPAIWPSYYDRAKGCEVWDLDGKKYTDMSYMGIGSCILGYADDDVNRAVGRAVCKGSMSTLNCPEEVKLAEVLCKIHSWAKMVRYARSGGEAMAIAVRIARAKTAKDLILFCGYHGWHDWYLAANLAHDSSLDGHLLPGLNPRGVPRALRGTAFPFTYNDTENFLRLIKRFKGKIAAIVMEPIRNHYPDKGFLETIRDITFKSKIVLIFDEITSGWRLCAGGAHKVLGIEPDMAVFAKAMSNGFPMAAVIGVKDVMDKAQETFISSTYWTERIGPAAALATIKKFEKNNMAKYLCVVGRKIQREWQRLAGLYRLNIETSGIYPLGHFSFKYKNTLILKTLYTQLMLEKGFLATNAFYASYAHKEKHIANYLEATDETFAFMAKAVRNGIAKKYLKGPVCHAGFRRIN